MSPIPRSAGLLLRPIAVHLMRDGNPIRVRGVRSLRALRAKFFGCGLSTPGFTVSHVLPLGFIPMGGARLRLVTVSGLILFCELCVLSRANQPSELRNDLGA